jgi:2,4-dienoyl-CoA reductase-like NADH-dependent reductase (Old Yellow Enzyme family)
MTGVFSPAVLGPVGLPNRIIKAATFEGRTPDGVVSDELVDFHRRHARGGIGMTTVAYCAVTPEGRTHRQQIWMRPAAVAGLRRLTNAVHGEGVAVAAQIGHAGPVANAASNRAAAIGPARAFSPLGFRWVEAATSDQLERIVRAHADAAALVVESGFDAVEIHCGHNYLLSAFLSPRLNKREDKYGGSLANRARLTLAVTRAVRDAVGDRVAITAKLNIEDGVRGGLRAEESLQVASWLEGDGTIDALELTAGSSLLNPMYVFTGDAPVREFAAAFPPPLSWGMRLGGHAFLRDYPYREAYLLPRAQLFRRELRLPLILLGGVTRRDTMESAMAEGFAFVAMARALLREPDLPRRLRSAPHTRSLCTHCNKCVPTIYRGTHCPLITDEPPRTAR